MRALLRSSHDDVLSGVDDDIILSDDDDLGPTALEVRARPPILAFPR